MGISTNACEFVCPGCGKKWTAIGELRLGRRGPDDRLPDTEIRCPECRVVMGTMYCEPEAIHVSPWTDDPVRRLDEVRRKPF